MSKVLVGKHDAYDMKELRSELLANYNLFDYRNLTKLRTPNIKVIEWREIYNKKITTS